MARLRKLGKSGNYFLVFSSRKRTPRETSVALGTSDGRAARKRANLVEDLYDRGSFDPWRYDTLPWEHRALTLADAVGRFLAAKECVVTPKTLLNYRSALEGWQRRLPVGLQLDSLQPKHLRPYIGDPHVSASTRRHRFRHLRVFVRWCTATKLLSEEHDPLRELPMPKSEAKHPTYVTAADAERIVAALEGFAEMEAASGRPLREGDVVWARDPITFALYTGLRRGEIAAARWSWVHFSPDGAVAWLTVQATRDGWQPKGKRARTVPLVGLAFRIVQRLYAERLEGVEDGPLFRGPQGGPINADKLSRLFKKGVRLAKLDRRLTFHSLRHGCASALVQKGVPIQIVGEVLGHSSTAVTEMYSHLQPLHLQRAMQAAFMGER